EASMALILQTLSPDRRMGALANGQQVVKSFRYHLTDPRQFDIMQSGHGWGGPNAVRSIETPRVRHAARRRGGVAARGGGATDDAGGRVSWFSTALCDHGSIARISPGPQRHQLHGRRERGDCVPARR